MQNVINNVQQNNQPQQLIRGGIYLVDLGVGKGSLQGKVRPCVLISNRACNTYSPVLHFCPVSSITSKSKLPTHIGLSKNNSGLLRDSIVLCEQTQLVTKDSIGRKVGQCSEEDLQRVSKGIAIQFGLVEVRNKVAYAN